MAEGVWWSRYSKPLKDEPCASGTMALVESSGGLSVVERVRYPSSLDGFGYLRSRDLLDSGGWGHHFLWAGQLASVWAPKGFSAAPIRANFEEALASEAGQGCPRWWVAG
jgi:hypothetical protein